LKISTFATDAFSDSFDCFICSVFEVTFPKINYRQLFSVIRCCRRASLQHIHVQVTEAGSLSKVTGYGLGTEGFGYQWEWIFIFATYSYWHLRPPKLLSSGTE
jgi:hypothetical protein